MVERICSRMRWRAARSRSIPARSGSWTAAPPSVCDCPLFTPVPSVVSALINGQQLVRQLQDDQRDARPVDRSDVVAVPRPVLLLHGQQLIACGGEVIVPVFVARLV